MKNHDLSNPFENPRSTPSPDMRDGPIVRSFQIPGGSGFFVDLANLAWDLRRSTTDVRSLEAKPTMSKVARHVDRLWDFLEQAGLKIQDHVNQPFDSGQSLEVLAFQPTPGVMREIVRSEERRVGKE